VKYSKIYFRILKNFFNKIFIIKIRFRVINETFVDTTPTGPSTSIVQTKEETKCPYSILGSIGEPGLGLISWWGS